MDIIITGLLAVAIGYYLLRVIRKSSRNVKAGKCMACDGQCTNGTCEIHLQDKA